MLFSFLWSRKVSQSFECVLIFVCPLKKSCVRLMATTSAAGAEG